VEKGGLGLRVFKKTQTKHNNKKNPHAPQTKQQTTTKQSSTLKKNKTKNPPKPPPTKT